MNVGETDRLEVVEGRLIINNRLFVVTFPTEHLCDVEDGKLITTFGGPFQNTWDMEDVKGYFVDQVKTIVELRADFEYMAQSCMFDVKRLPNGEYSIRGRNTFTLWAGYWECAKKNGIIDPSTDNLEMNKI